MPKKLECDRWKKEVSGCKNLHKVKKEFLCDTCYKENKKKHREDTISKAGIEEELKELDKKIKKEYYTKQNAKRKIVKIEEPPKIKGSKEDNKKKKSYSYLTFEDKKMLISIAIKRGLSYEDAIENMKDIEKDQRRIRKEMQKQNKSEEEIIQKQKQLLEELWSYQF